MPYLEWKRMEIYGINTRKDNMCEKASSVLIINNVTILTNSSCKRKYVKKQKRNMKTRERE